MRLLKSVVLRERSGVGCALACQDGIVLLAWTGTDEHINTAWSRDGLVFGDKCRLPHRSACWPDSDSRYFMPPAVAGSAAGFHLAWADRYRSLHHQRVGGSLVADFAELSAGQPALAAAGEELVIAWHGLDAHHRLARRRDGAWDAEWRMEEGGRYTPAVWATTDELALAFVGADGLVRVLRQRDGDWHEPLVLAEMPSYNPPALCARDDELVVGWVGRGSYLSLAVVGSEGAVRTCVLPIVSRAAPALCALGESIVMAWIGFDRRINVGLFV
jgi:hypothetical protein